MAETLLAVPARWRAPLAAQALVVVALLVLYAPTARGMWDIWSRSETYAHGFVVPLICAWLIWRVRHRLAPLAPCPAPTAWVLMAGAAALWLLGDLVAVNAATQLALVMLLVLSVPAVLGWAVARALAFPLAFLFFAVPIGDFMLPRLMEWTADFTVLALRATGLPVYREGLQFVIPSGTWSVVEACSGIRYLIASVTVGSLFAYLSYRSATKRWVFVGVSIAVPLVANWMRAYMIVMIGHLSGNELATGVDHLVYGWLFFGVVILVMLLIGMRWADPVDPLDTAAPATPVGAAGAASAPVTAPATSPRPFVAALAVALLVLWLPQGAERALRWRVNTAAVLPVLPAAQAGWQTAAPVASWQPAFQHPSAQLAQTYRDPAGHAVTLHLSHYRDQNYQRKLVSSENMLVRSDDPHWARVDSGAARVRWAGQGVSVATATLRAAPGALTASAAQRLLVWRLYWVNDRLLASDARAKLEGAWGLLRGWGDDGAIVVLHTPLPEHLPPATAQQQAAQALQAWVDAHGAGVLAALRRTREGD